MITVSVTFISDGYLDADGSRVGPQTHRCVFIRQVKEGLRDWDSSILQERRFPSNEVPEGESGIIVVSAAFETPAAMFTPLRSDRPHGTNAGNFPGSSIRRLVLSACLCVSGAHGVM